MKRIHKKSILSMRLLALALSIALFAGSFFSGGFGSLFVFAEENTGDALENSEFDVGEDGFILISSSKDLAAIAENPSGNYRLTRDIDMSGKDWSPLYFSGVFDGAGYSILNLEVSQVSTDIRTTIDGNWIEYDTVFSGFFGVCEGAEISNLTLLGANVDINISADCFIGLLAGYTSDTTIKNCTITGMASLSVNADMFGVGGIVGFGNGEITDSSVDATLVCIDTNKEERDEQFMGGVNACGYMSIDNVTVTIDGYDSDHGYVHNGGISGMFILPWGVDYYGYVTNNTVNGSITFFEDNTDRRAYCVYDIGEIMNWNFDYTGNVDNFTSNEIFDYSEDLGPETCDSPTYTEIVTEATEDSFGYTTYTCEVCGYTFKSAYTLKVGTEPETEESAEDSAEVKNTSDADVKTVSKSQHKTLKVIGIVIGVVAAVIIILLVLAAIVRAKRRKARRRRMEAARRRRQRMRQQGAARPHETAGRRPPVR